MIKGKIIKKTKIKIYKLMNKKFYVGNNSCKIKIHMLKYKQLKKVNYPA